MDLEERVNRRRFLQGLSVAAGILLRKGFARQDPHACIPSVEGINVASHPSPLGDVLVQTSEVHLPPFKGELIMQWASGREEHAPLTTYLLRIPRARHDFTLKHVRRVNLLPHTLETAYAPIGWLPHPHEGESFFLQLTITRKERTYPAVGIDELIFTTHEGERRVINTVITYPAFTSGLEGRLDPLLTPWGVLYLEQESDETYKLIALYGKAATYSYPPEERIPGITPADIISIKQTPLEYAVFSKNPPADWWENQLGLPLEERSLTLTEVSFQPKESYIQISYLTTEDDYFNPHWRIRVTHPHVQKGLYLPLTGSDPSPAFTYEETRETLDSMTAGDFIANFPRTTFRPPCPSRFIVRVAPGSWNLKPENIL